ncbi:MAG: DUF4340 domain-containing protein [Candidatus Aminicenantales bacterium]
MKFRTTLILLAVFTGLLAVVLIFESKGKREAAVKEKEQKLVDVAAADVERIELKKEDGTISFRKDAKGAWLITAPLEAKADGAEVDGLISGFSSLRIERVVEKEAKDLKAYEIPKQEVALWVKGKGAPVKVLIGMENPLDKSLFAKREDDPRLVLLSSSLKTTLDKKVFDFREKDIFKFETAEVKSVRVRAKDVSWEAAREADAWLLKSPVRALANKAKMDTLLESLSALKAKDFLSETKNPGDVKKLGLEKPEYEVALTMPAANKDMVFSLHKDGDRSYAMTSQSNKIIAFEGSLLADLEKKPDELREKKVTAFYSWEAQKVFLKRGPFQLTAAKEKVKDEDKWLLETAAKDAADGDKIDSFIRKIEGLEATSFIDNPKSLAEYGLDKPAAEVTVWTKGNDGKTMETGLLVGKEDKDKKQVIVKNVKLDYLFRVDASFLQDLPKEAKDWKAEPAKPADAGGKKK